MPIREYDYGIYKKLLLLDRRFYTSLILDTVAVRISLPQHARQEVTQHRCGNGGSFPLLNAYRRDP